jgi:tRNA(fMet)-specific endonuclease VapC
MFASDVTMWILDTDHVSFILGGDRRVNDRLDQVKSAAAVTIITVQEVFNGWVGELNQPHANKETLLKKYRRFYLPTELFRQVRIMEFQQDMRIAAIALSIGATVATRNQRDFGLVPGLTTEDWTI